ncbi:MAG: PIN domain-containing protein [Desulfovibrionales bacterium]|nr:PIN domain-containing protein [Desulfovibrionales bacterium]
MITITIFIDDMIFIDTGAFIARYLKKDQFHQQSLSLWSDLELKNEKLVTSNFVLDETATLLSRRAGNVFAAKRLKNIYTSYVFQILRPDRDDEITALDLMDKFSDQAVSFTDCVSFVLMNRMHIESVFTFDRHFDLADFIRIPE